MSDDARESDEVEPGVSASAHWFLEYCCNSELTAQQRAAMEQKLAADHQLTMDVAGFAGAVALITPFDPGAAREALTGTPRPDVAGVRSISRLSDVVNRVRAAAEGLGAWLVRTFGWFGGLGFAAFVGWVSLALPHQARDVVAPAQWTAADSLGARINAAAALSTRPVTAGRGAFVIERASAHETLRVREPGFAVIVLHPGGQLAYWTLPRTTLERFRGGIPEATFEGEGALTIMPDHRLRLRTPSGVVDLGAGMYAVRAVAGSGQVQVGVAIGQATVHGPGIRETVVGAGHVLIAGRGQLPVIHEGIGSLSPLGVLAEQGRTVTTPAEWQWSVHLW